MCYCAVFLFLHRTNFFFQWQKNRKIICSSMALFFDSNIHTKFDSILVLFFICLIKISEQTVQHIQRNTNKALLIQLYTMVEFVVVFDTIYMYIWLFSADWLLIQFYGYFFQLKLCGLFDIQLEFAVAFARGKIVLEIIPHNL